MNQEQANWEWIDARVKKLEKHCFSEKTLTDEEIMECKAHVEVMYGCLAPLEFAWEILRKAQEK